MNKATDNRASSAADELMNRGADSRDCDGLNEHSVLGSTKSWDSRSQEGDTRHRLVTDPQPAGGGHTDRSDRGQEQAGNGKQAARRALVFVSEGATATRYL